MCCEEFERTASSIRASRPTRQVMDFYLELEKQKHKKQTGQYLRGDIYLYIY